MTKITVPANPPAIAIGLSQRSEPLLIAHRGAGIYSPEHTLLAYRTALSMSDQIIIELDVRALADGTLVVMHDDTVDRTTTSTGNVADYNALTWRALRMRSPVSTAVYNVPSDTSPAFLGDVLREFANRAVLCIEFKSSGIAQSVVDAVIDAGVTRDHVIFQDFTNAELLPARAAGFKTMLVGDSLVPVTVLSQGHEYVGCSSAVSESYVAGFTALGLKVVPYTINRRWQKDLFDSYGVSGYFTDDPLYIGSSAFQLTSDPYSGLNSYPGMQPQNVFSTGIISMVGGSLVFDNSLATFRGQLQGWLSPLGASFTLAFSVKFVNTYFDSSKWASVFLGTTDNLFADGAAADEEPDGYHFLMRKSGTLALYRVDAGVTTSLGSVATSAIADGATATFQISVTPTAITLSRTGFVTPVTSSDTTYRPLPFPTFGCDGIKCEWSGVTVT